MLGRSWVTQDGIGPRLRLITGSSNTLAPPSLTVCEHLQLDWFTNEFNGASGPVQASFPNLEDSLSRAWVDTFRHLGYAIQNDPFSGEALGAYNCPSTVDHVTQERSYTATALYAPISDCSNLHLMKCSMVEKILLEKVNQTFLATGVQFLRGDSCEVVRAWRETILAAGALWSLKLLELSGIGSKDILERYGIQSLINNACVGENL